MKKILVAILAALLLVAMAACTDPEAPETSGSTQATTASSPMPTAGENDMPFVPAN